LNTKESSADPSAAGDAATAGTASAGTASAGTAEGIAETNPLAEEEKDGVVPAPVCPPLLLMPPPLPRVNCPPHPQSHPPRVVARDAGGGDFAFALVPVVVVAAAASGLLAMAEAQASVSVGVVTVVAVTVVTVITAVTAAAVQNHLGVEPTPPDQRAGA